MPWRDNEESDLCHRTWHLFLLLGPEVTGDIFAFFLGQQLLWDSSGKWLSWYPFCYKENSCIYTRERTAVSVNLLPSQFVWRVSSQKSSVPLSWWYHDPHLSQGHCICFVLLSVSPALSQCLVPGEHLKRVHAEWKLGQTPYSDILISDTDLIFQCPVRWGSLFLGEFLHRKGENWLFPEEPWEAVWSPGGCTSSFFLSLELPFQPQFCWPSLSFLRSSILSLTQGLCVSWLLFPAHLKVGQAIPF